MEGGTLASKTLAQPMYLNSADPGIMSGGTTNFNSTIPSIQQYENVFGPVARDIKEDSQRHKRHQRWHLPDVLKGPNTFLTDRVDGLITDATNSPFTRNILPYVYLDSPDQKLKWNVYSFDEGMASRVPYEAAARVLPQTKRSFAGYVVRQGLAIAMEHNFMMSPKGQENFKNQLLQLVGSIQLTNDLDVHVALLTAPSYQKHQNEKYMDSTMSMQKICRKYTDMFGICQKIPNAIDFLIEDTKTILKSWGSQPPTFCLCNGKLQTQLTMLPEKTNYVTNGPDGLKRLAQGPELPSYRGVSFINSRQFSMETGAAPRDLLRRRVRVGEYVYTNTFDINEVHEGDFQGGGEGDEIRRARTSNTGARNRYQIYDQSKDSFTQITGKALLKNAYSPSDRQITKNFDDRNNQLQEDAFMIDYKNNLLQSFNTVRRQFYQEHGQTKLREKIGAMFADFAVENDDITANELFTLLTNNDSAPFSWLPGQLPDPDNKRNVMLFVLRPNIEHEMLGVIMGRGGTQELGATFWGQTEMSCYDDAQHGIWGMSYKYHERALVTNERNLVRVYDVAFDGYNGGMDSECVNMQESNSIEAFQTATMQKNTPYEGASNIVFVLPCGVGVDNLEWPSPLVFSGTGLENTETGDRAKDINNYTFDKLLGLNFWQRVAWHLQWTRLGLENWIPPKVRSTLPGDAAVTGHTTQVTMAFQGTLKEIGPNGSVILQHGSGHLGPSFPGVASVREGRGRLYAEGANGVSGVNLGHLV